MSRPEVLVEVEGLVKRYGGLQAVAGIDFSIRRGEIVGLLGPNGAGKTTTIRMLLGLVRPTAGAVRIAGVPVERSDGSLQRMIGWVPQTPSLDPLLSGREQLWLLAALYSVPDPHRRVEEALRRFGLEEAADRPIRTYSGGMKKRLELAAATMHEPALLILDEPTAALDVQARYQIWGLIRQLNAQGTTVLLTTHYLEEADALCHRIGILDRGRLRALDSPALLKRRHGRARLRLTWSDPDAAAAALPLLADALDVQPSRLRAAGGLVEVPADDLVGALDLVFRALREQHLPPPDQVETLPPTLDQVFAQVTGSAVDPVTGEAFTLQDAAGADGTSGPTRTDSEAAAPPDADSQAVAVGEAGTVAGDTRPAPAAAASWRPGAFIRDNLTLLRRWWWRLRREPVEMIVTATQPALWLLIFGNLWERAALSWAEGGYLRFMTGGAVMMTVFNVALMGGLDLLLDRERGAMDRWLVTPVHPLALVTSRFTFVTALAAVQVLSTSPCSTTGSSTR